MLLLLACHAPEQVPPAPSPADPAEVAVDIPAAAFAGVESLGSGVADAGDVDGNGLVDLLLVSELESRLWLAPLDTRIPASPDASWQGRVSFGDTNGDGRADAIVANELMDGLIQIFRDPLGPPQPVLLVEPFSGPLSGADDPRTASADFDGDGVGDLLVWDADNYNGLTLFSGPITAALTVEDATFALESFSADVPGFPDVEELLVADLTGDGGVDLLVPMSEPGWPTSEVSHAWLLDDFSESALGLDDAARWYQSHTTEILRVAGDLDGDGHLDLIGNDAGAVHWFAGPFERSGGLDHPVGVVETEEPFGNLATPGDVDGDGEADLVVGWSGQPEAWLVPGPIGPGTRDLADTLRFRAPGFGTGLSLAGPGDHDGDTVPDIAFGSTDLLWIVSGRNLVREPF